MLIYFSNNPLTVKGQLICLDQDESHHIARVMRMKEGDFVYVTDGLGNLTKAIIDHIGKKEVTVISGTIEKQTIITPELLTVAVAPTKNADRYEWFVEKATEIGIKKIIPLICEHSERTNMRIDRLKKIALSAMKQSTRTVLPEISEPVKFYDLIKMELPEQRFIAYAEELQSDHLSVLYQVGKETIILIGPEGDFSKNELELASTKGFKTVTLGNARLRTETAAMFVCSLVKTIENK